MRHTLLVWTRLALRSALAALVERTAGSDPPPRQNRSLQMHPRLSSTKKAEGRGGGWEAAWAPEQPSMQPVPGCRTRVWKKEWRQTGGSQTSLTTGTRRIADRVERGVGGVVGGVDITGEEEEEEEEG